MFKKTKVKNLPEHIKYFKYYRNKDSLRMSDIDKKSINDFYEKQNIKIKDLTTYQQTIVFKRSLNFMCIIAYYYRRVGGTLKVVRTRVFVYHRDGSMLYDLDHDYQRYGNQIEHRNLLKKNYDIHDRLDNPHLVTMGGHLFNLRKFLQSCNELLKEDVTLNSIDFILGE